MDSTPDILELAAVLKNAQRILIFTGAGISTGSNIPDYRGPEGVWQRRQPVYYDDFLEHEASRVEFWDFKLESYGQFRDAKPNAAHEAIVRLEQLAKVEAVVTQNTDGLHRLAGTSSERLIELHGTNTEVECIGCGRRESPERCMQEFEGSRRPPTCTECGGYMKAAVVMFGQALNAHSLERARDAVLATDCVMALGSSLVVTPAADIPMLAAKRGVPYIIVNRGETPHDTLATLRFEEDVAEVLVAALKHADL